MSFARNVTTVGAATLVSRVLGFARDTLIAAALGAGPVADAFVVAFRLPLLVRRLFAEGAFNTVFVPLYAQAEREGQGPAFVRDVFSLIAISVAGLTVIGLVGMPWLIALIAPGFRDSGGSLELAVELARTAFPYCLLTLLTVVGAALLNAQGRFASAAYAPALANVSMIGALAWVRMGGTAPAPAARILAWSIVVGAVMQLLAVLAALRGTDLGLRLGRPRLGPGVRRFFRLVGPGVAVAGITQVNAFVGLVIASPRPGAVAWLYYADRVYQLPLGVVSVAVGLALLPDLSRHLARGDRPAERAAFSRAVEFAAFLSLPAALALGIAARPIVTVLFERGAFTAADTQEVARTLAAYAAGLPAFVAARVLQPLFFARTSLRAPLLIALIGVVADIALSLLLFPSWRQVGIAIAGAASGWINAGLLAAVAARRGLAGLDALARRRLLGIGLASLAMAASLATLVPALAGIVAADRPLAWRLVALTLLCGGGLTVFVAASLLFGGLDWPGLKKALRQNGDGARQTGSPPSG